MKIDVDSVDKLRLDYRVVRHVAVLPHPLGFGGIYEPFTRLRGRAVRRHLRRAVIRGGRRLDRNRHGADARAPNKGAWAGSTENGPNIDTQYQMFLNSATGSAWISASFNVTS